MQKHRIKISQKLQQINKLSKLENLKKKKPVHFREKNKNK